MNKTRCEFLDDETHWHRVLLCIILYRNTQIKIFGFLCEIKISVTIRAFSFTHNHDFWELTLFLLGIKRVFHLRVFHRRADIEQLLKRTGLKLEAAASGAESGGPVGKAAKMQEQMFMNAVSECTSFPSFTKRLYPCWVISLTNLAALDELPQHEGDTRCIVPSCSFSIQFSITLMPDDHCLRRFLVPHNMKIASSSSRSYSPTAPARRAHTASSSARIGRADDPAPNPRASLRR